MTDDPIALFDAWFAEARGSEPNDPEAMALATADADGRPSVRMVLLKGHDDRGFVFYTNLDSRKGGELAANPEASLLFHWKSLRRQVRISGPVEPVNEAEADAYFASRGRDSRLGAWASDQSRPLADRATFETRFEQMREKFEGSDVPPSAALVGLSRYPAGDRILAGPRPPPPRASPVHPRWRQLERKPALPMTAAPTRDELRAQLTTRAAIASITMAVFLVVLKSYAAIHTGSVAMLGSLADTALDLLASLVTLAGVRFAAMPADDDHRFGHGKAEALAALAQVVLISISALGIAWRAIDRLTSSATTEGLELGFAVSMVAIGATFALLAYQRHVIKRTGSVAIETDHVHYQSDLLLNLSVIVALVLDQLIGLAEWPTHCSGSRSPRG